MAEYTIQLRTLCENAAKRDGDYSEVEQIIDHAKWFIFDFTYPIFDENYRPVLERKILRHFYNYEIGAETVGLWKQQLATKLNEIMPYYNKLYLTNDMIIEPLIDVDYIRESVGGYDKKTNGNEIARSRTDYTTDGNTTDATGTISYERFSDTPQGSLTNIENDRYLTNATKNNTNTTNNGTNHSTTINDTNRDINNSENEVTETKDNTHMKGNYGGRSKSAMLKEYRETIINIDLMVMRDLETLFMQIW